MDEKMSRRGTKAMERSQKSRRKATEMFSKYTTNYRHLAAAGDKAMVKAWSKANRVRENWMNPERFQAIPEEEEPPPEPPEETTIEATAENPENPEEGIKSSGQGRVKKLTDFFNQIGGPKPPKGPRTPNKAPKTPGRKKGTSTPGAGGVSKTKKKGKPIIDEKQRAKLEFAMKSFLKKKPRE